MLPIEDFKFIVQNTILVAIDLIIENQKGQILLGRRNNKPAQGYLFVPGGRIFKNEKTSEALERISSTEIGIKLTEEDIILHGIYEHIYEENFFGSDEFNTHYIVISCRAKLNYIDVKPDLQHNELKFYDKDFIINSSSVHHFTKNYFINGLVDNEFLK